MVPYKLLPRQLLIIPAVLLHYTNLLHVKDTSTAPLLSIVRPLHTVEKCTCTYGPCILRHPYIWPVRTGIKKCTHIYGPQVRPICKGSVHRPVALNAMWKWNQTKTYHTTID